MVMNTDTHRNGCHNRIAFKIPAVVQDGYFVDGATRVPKMVASPFRMAQDCQYTKTELGKVDKGCDGCKWMEKTLPISPENKPLNRHENYSQYSDLAIKSVA